MKRQKKNLIAVLSFLSLLSMSNVNIFAKESIPNSMSPNTLIKYTDEKNYTILNETEKKNNEFNKDTFKEVGSSNLSIDDSKVIVANYPDPCKGMYVKYGSDGLVSKIYILKDSKENVTNNVSYQDKNITRGASDPSYTLIAKWGSYPNRLYKGIKHYGDYKYYGKGRATTFSDQKGTHDNYLVTGDIALQKDYDPCAYNSDVIVALPRTNGSIETHVMKKRDIGSMPNAIVDIWKNGVSYWGYTYNSSLSIGNATIQHN